MPIAAGLARTIQQTGWDLAVILDKDAELGEFAVFLDDEKVFSRLEQRRLPDPADIIPLIQSRLFGEQQS